VNEGRPLFYAALLFYSYFIFSASRIALVLGNVFFLLEFSTITPFLNNPNVPDLNLLLWMKLFVKLSLYSLSLSLTLEDRYFISFSIALNALSSSMYSFSYFLFMSAKNLSLISLLSLEIKFYESVEVITMSERLANSTIGICFNKYL